MNKKTLPTSLPPQSRNIENSTTQKYLTAKPLQHCRLAHAASLSSPICNIYH